MKYYLITIQKLKDGTNPVGIFAYNSFDEIRSVYHSTLASNYANMDITYFCVAVMDEESVIYLSEKYTRPEKPEEEQL